MFLHAVKVQAWDLSALCHPLRPRVRLWPMLIHSKHHQVILCPAATASLPHPLSPQHPPSSLHTSSRYSLFRHRHLNPSTLSPTSTRTRLRTATWDSHKATTPSRASLWSKKWSSMMPMVNTRQSSAKTGLRLLSADMRASVVLPMDKKNWPWLPDASTTISSRARTAGPSTTRSSACTAPAACSVTSIATLSSCTGTTTRPRSTFLRLFSTRRRTRQSSWKPTFPPPQHYHVSQTSTPTTMLSVLPKLKHSSKTLRVSSRRSRWAWRWPTLPIIAVTQRNLPKMKILALSSTLPKTV